MTDRGGRVFGELAIDVSRLLYPLDGEVSSMTRVGLTTPSRDATELLIYWGQPDASLLPLDEARHTEPSRRMVHFERRRMEYRKSNWRVIEEEATNLLDAPTRHALCPMARGVIDGCPCPSYGAIRS